MRFYGLSPLELEALPPYLYDPLVNNLEVLQAIETSREYTASMLPHLKKSGQRSIMGMVRRVLERAQPVFERQYELIEYDPARAADFFSGQGMKVMKKASDDEQ